LHGWFCFAGKEQQRQKNKNVFKHMFLKISREGGKKEFVFFLSFPSYRQ